MEVAIRLGSREHRTRVRSGRLRDLRTGQVHGSEGEMVRTCVNAPEGPIEIAL